MRWERHRNSDGFNYLVSSRFPCGVLELRSLNPSETWRFPWSLPFVFLSENKRTSLFKNNSYFTCPAAVNCRKLIHYFIQKYIIHVEYYMYFVHSFIYFNDTNRFFFIRKWKKNHTSSTLLLLYLYLLVFFVQWFIIQLHKTFISTCIYTKVTSVKGWQFYYTQFSLPTCIPSRMSLHTCTGNFQKQAKHRFLKDG